MRLIRLDENNIIVNVRTGTRILKDEIESKEGQIGQRRLDDGTFVDVSIELTEQEPSIEEQILVETQYQTALLEMQMLGGM